MEFRSWVVVARPDAARLFQAPEKAVRLVNATLAVGNSRCMFVTRLIAAFEGTTGRLTYVRAGHVLPLLQRASGQSSGWARPAVAARIDGGRRSQLRSGAACSGRRLLIVTDGITEAMGPAR